MIAKNEKIINDPVHGTIQLEEFAVDIINTRYFQRLHHVRQLDIAYLVYPGAMHTRFEHCIGTYYIARALLQSINLDNSRYANIIKISALIHDIGHGPFSHQYDSARVDDIHHEKRARGIIETMSKEISNPETLRYFTPENIDLICRIINGDNDFISDGHKTPDSSPIRYKVEEDEEDNNHNKTHMKYNDDIPSYVFEIVSNHYNGIDVDRFDYIIRDSYYTGVYTSFNLQRILQVVELRNNHIVFPKKDFYTIFLFFQARYILHKLVYQHKTVICYGKALRHIIKRHINQIRVLDWEDQTDENLLFLMRTTDTKFKKIKKKYPNYEEFKSKKIEDVINECNIHLTPEEIKDLIALTKNQYNELELIGADNILYRIPVYKIAKKIVLKRLDMESYHDLEKLPDILYNIQNGKPNKLDQKQVQTIQSNTESLKEAINEGLYSFTEPMDSTFEIKDEVTFGFGVPSQSFYNNILFFDKDEPDESSVKSYEELHESACLPSEWFEYSINYYNKIN